MVTLEQLQALDLQVWLRSCDRAAALAGTNQSTISRRRRAVLRQFGRHQPHGGVGAAADWARLLAMERQLHQRARFLGHQPLRLQVPFWTRRARLRRLPAGWCANPAVIPGVCDEPVALLRERVIDACLLTSCQMPANADDLVLLELYARPIELTLFPCRWTGDPVAAFQRQRQDGSLRLRPMPFLPSSCGANAEALFSSLTRIAAPPRPTANRRPTAADGVSVAFLTEEMRQAQERPWCVDPGFEPYPYVERLAVLAEHVHEAAVERLLEHLAGVFPSLR